MAPPVQHFKNEILEVYAVPPCVYIHLARLWCQSHSLHCHLEQVRSDDGCQRAADPEPWSQLALEAPGSGLRRHRTRRLRQSVNLFTTFVCSK